MDFYSWNFSTWATTIAGAEAALHSAGLTTAAASELDLLALAQHHNGIDHYSRAQRVELQNTLQQLLEQHYINIWRTRPNEQLIQFIIREFHRAHFAQLPHLLSSARQLQKQLKPQAIYFERLTNTLFQLQEELFEHMHHEEQTIFPALLQPTNFDSFCSLAILHHNHDGHIAALQKIDTICQDFLDEIPLDETPHDDILKLINQLENFSMQLRLHIALENSLIFTGT